MYRQRIQMAWGHTAHRCWARLLLNRARDIIIHDPAHHGANGAAMPTGEGDEGGHFFLTALRAGPPFSWGETSGGPPGGRSLSKDGTRADSAKDFCRLVVCVYYAGNLI